MMRLRFVLLGLLLFTLDASAEGGAKAQPVKGELQLIYLFEGQKTEFIFVIGQAGFKSVSSLEKHLETWAPGSELRWAPGCIRFGGEPLSSEKEMKEFRRFLVKRNIRFVLIPSG